MIQKAIVESIIDDYSVKIRIPKYDKTYVDGFSYNDLSTGTICTIPGSNIMYSVGDVILVGFENDEIGKPVVLGLLYTDKESDSTIKINSMSDALEKVENVLDNINNTVYYTHIKYSNDGGITFTSLYDYSDQKKDKDTLYCKDIIIDKKSSFIKWDIVDNNNANAFNSFQVKVVIHNGDETLESSDEIIDIPDSFNYGDGLVVDYYITPVGVDIKDYNIALYTDKNPLGTTEGDFVGIFNSDNYISSLNPVDYAWLSIKTRIQKFIDEASDNLLERVKIIERYLFGKLYDEKEDSQTGVNSAIDVDVDTLSLKKKKTVNLTDNIYIDTHNNSIFFNGIALVAGSNGHLTIK